MTLQNLNLNKDLCRCCHAEGSFADLAQPYLNDEVEEVYSDMIKDCFNIEVTPVPGPLCVVTYKICKKCIKRVQDAYLFKNQVKKCEILFMEIYKRTASENKGVGLNTTVKEELSESDARDDFSLMNDFGDDDFCMKSEDSDDNTALVELKNTKAKSKAAVKPKPKKVKEVKTKKIKEEKEADAPKTEAKKKKGKLEEEQNYTLTKDADGTDNYSCNSCQKTFKNRPCFKQHYNHVHLHLRPKLIGCYYCDVKVPPHMRAFHLEDMHGIQAPTCNACGKKFSRNCEVLRHQQIFHMGEKKYICDVCNMRFARRNSLRQHVVKHSSARNFKCDYCDKAFKWRKHLRRHLLLHMKRQN